MNWIESFRQWSQKREEEKNQTKKDLLNYCRERIEQEQAMKALRGHPTLYDTTQSKWLTKQIIEKKAKVRTENTLKIMKQSKAAREKVHQELNRLWDQKKRQKDKEHER